MEKKNFEKMKTTELLDIKPDKLSDEEHKEWDEALTKRDPFGYLDGEVDELRKMIEELQTKFRRHEHKGNYIVMRE